MHLRSGSVPERVAEKPEPIQEAANRALCPALASVRGLVNKVAGSAAKPAHAVVQKAEAFGIIRRISYEQFLPVLAFVGGFQYKNSIAQAGVN